MDRELIKDNLLFLNDYMPKLLHAVEELVDLLITSKETDALKLLTSIIEGLEWTLRSLSGLENIGVVRELNLAQMNEILREMTNAFEKKDYVLLGDILQYEITEVLSDWMLKLKDVKGEEL